MEAPQPPDNGDNQHQHPDQLVNQDPGVIAYSYAIVTIFLRSYGWYLLFACIALWYLKGKLQPYFDKQKKKWDSAQEQRNYDPEVSRQRQEAMEQARSRLQEQHEAKAALFLEEQQKKDEEKRKERIKDWERHQEGKGYRSKVKVTEEPQSSASAPPKSKKNVYRNKDYNPLTGAGGGGAAFRPGRRSGGG